MARAADNQARTPDPRASAGGVHDLAGRTMGMKLWRYVLLLAATFCSLGVGLAADGPTVEAQRAVARLQASLCGTDIPDGQALAGRILSGDRAVDRAVKGALPADLTAELERALRNGAWTPGLKEELVASLRVELKQQFGKSWVDFVGELPAEERQALRGQVEAGAELTSRRFVEVFYRSQIRVLDGLEYVAERTLLAWHRRYAFDQDGPGASVEVEPSGVISHFTYGDTAEETPLPSDERPASAGEAAQMALQWLTEHQVTDANWQLREAQRMPNSSRPGQSYDLEWGRQTPDGVWLPATLSASIDQELGLVRFHRVERPLEIPTKVGVTRAKARRTAVRAAGRGAVPLSDCVYVWMDPDGRQRLWWTWQFDPDREPPTVRLDAVTGEVEAVYISPRAHMLPLATVEAAARRRRRAAALKWSGAVVLVALIAGSWALRRRRRRVGEG